MYPDAGVIPASPAMTPFITAMQLGLPRIQERAIHTSPEHDPPICVETTADVAMDPDARALPALNPNQPIHRRVAPSAARGRFEGGNSPWYLLRKFNAQ
jgi:hypothetical protein